MKAIKKTAMLADTAKSRPYTAITFKIAVDRHRPTNYSASVAKKEATGFSSLNTHSGHTAQRGFFTSVDSWRTFNGGLVGEAFGLAGGCVYRSANPAQFRHPHLAVRSGLNATHGVHHA